MTGEAKAVLADDGPAIADVLLPVAIEQSYSYAVPGGIHVAPGDFVEVPLGTRMAQGVVWETRRGQAGRANLKPVAARLELPPLSPNTRKFIDWVARWTLSPRGMVLRMAIGGALHIGPEPVRVGVRLTGSPPGRMTKTRARVLGGSGRRPGLPQIGARRGRRLFGRRHRFAHRRRRA